LTQTLFKVYFNYCKVIFFVFNIYGQKSIYMDFCPLTEE